MPHSRRSSLLAGWAVALLVAAAWLWPAAGHAQGRPLRLVVLGDSLSSGFLLAPEQALPAVLETSLRQTGIGVAIANASVVNDTSWDGLARLERDVPPGTDGVIVELGANDQLMRTAPAVTRRVLEQIVARLRARRIPVMLVGFRMPLPWSNDSPRFAAMYEGVASRNRLLLHPDIYDGIWSDRSLIGKDGIHPSAAGVQRMAANLLPTVLRFVRTLPQSQPHARPRGAAG